MTAESTYLDRIDPGPPLDLRVRLLQFAQMTVGFGGLTPEGAADNPYYVAGVNETARLLRHPSIWATTDHDALADAFGSLCQAVADIADLDTDPLAGGRSRAEADVARGTALADRDWYLDKLIGLAK